jgi:hypothetical protein
MGTCLITVLVQPGVGDSALHGHLLVRLTCSPKHQVDHDRRSDYGVNQEPHTMEAFQIHIHRTIGLIHDPRTTASDYTMTVDK